jgi:aspartate/methionine/tyrosine aminotransferase
VLERAAIFTDYWEGILAESRPVIVERLADWTRRGLVEGVMPAHGCIVFPRLVGVDDSAAFADFLLERSGVIVAPGSFFGASDRIRIGFGRDAASLSQGLDRLEDALLAFCRRSVKVAALG